MSKSTGNMYSFVTRTWNPVGGSCPIDCPYCFVKRLKARYPQIAAKYSRRPRLTGPWPKFKAGEVVFVCSCTDLFAMPSGIIDAVLSHCHRWSDATYVLQSKMPWMHTYWSLPPQTIFGTTIESDNIAGVLDRLEVIPYCGQEQTFITIEPVMQFSPDFAASIIHARPSFVNIGADSGGNNLSEPTKEETLGLIADLRNAGIEVHIKPNLRRIVGKESAK